ncbi:MAG: hypothetical protein JKY53_02205 [Flavobacteriales bacterium]|nr:hypothetical protein [Flavobacteriales bacterium]
MRISLIIIITTLLFPVEGLKMVSSKKVDCTNFTTDNLGNVYLIKGNTIEKYLPNGTLQNQYSSKIYGEINFVDTRNPLQILLFYPDITKIVFLDNTLSVHHDISLEQYQLEQVNLVCSSVNNSIWVYDQSSLQLIRFNQQINKIQETGNIIQLLGVEINPNYLLESNNHIYLNDPEIGIFVFDIFGTYLKTIPIKGLSSFQVTETHIHYIQQGDVYSFDFKTLESNKITLPFLDIDQFRIEKNSIYTLKQQTLAKYIID